MLFDLIYLSKNEPGNVVPEMTSHGPLEYSLRRSRIPARRDCPNFVSKDDQLWLVKESVMGNNSSVIVAEHLLNAENDVSRNKEAVKAHGPSQ